MLTTLLGIASLRANDTCALDQDKAHAILIQYADHHYDELLMLMDRGKLNYIDLYIRNETYYSHELGRYLFPLAAVHNRNIKGHIWLEVTCEEELKLSFYIEEV